MRVPLLTSEPLERPLAASSAAAGTPYRLEIVSSDSPSPTTIGEPPAAVQPTAEPPTGWALRAAETVCVAVGAGAPCASGTEVTAGVGVASAVLLANGLEKGLLENGLGLVLK